MFHKRGRFGVEKVQNNEIHVKVVLDEYFLGAYNFVIPLNIPDKYVWEI